METYYSLKVLHVLVGSVWLGAGLLAPRDVRDTLRAGPTFVPALMGRLRRTARVMNTSAMLTVLTGVALVLAMGGFGAVPLRINLGLALTAAAYAVGRWLIRPSVAEIAQSTALAVTGGDAERMANRFSRAVNAEHVLRFLVLGLMVYPLAL